MEQKYFQIHSYTNYYIASYLQSVYLMMLLDNFRLRSILLLPQKQTTILYISAIQILPTDMENTIYSHFITVIVVVFYFYFYIVMEKCSFLSIVISFVRNICLLTSITRHATFSFKDFFGKLDHIRKLLRICFNLSSRSF